MLRECSISHLEVTFPDLSKRVQPALFRLFGLVRILNHGEHFLLTNAPPFHSMYCMAVKDNFFHKPSLSQESKNVKSMCRIIELRVNNGKFGWPILGRNEER